ncbi:type IV toxin-antitoxin system AbiEi family antitoxin domain-containing protein [Phycicoccus sp. SLBN-51]|uniref:type IV toxin-antitoxin system AbiEi family antitoxin domain-containing protein n=1 Tax=Phycicoccus sp. SLBN-51 TaxID=2768447 RepID=UPI00336A8E1E
MTSTEPALRDLALSQGGAFGAGQARRLGVTDLDIHALVRQGEVVRPPGRLRPVDQPAGAQTGGGLRPAREGGAVVEAGTDLGFTPRCARHLRAASRCL